MSETMSMSSHSMADVQYVELPVSEVIESKSANNSDDSYNTVVDSKGEHNSSSDSDLRKDWTNVELDMNETATTASVPADMGDAIEGQSRSYSDVKTVFDIDQRQEPFIQVDHSAKSKARNLSNWGEMVGIYVPNGQSKRVVTLDEVKNYVQISVKKKTHFKFYLSLIDGRFPRLLKNVIRRWRMRYNIFVGGVFDTADDRLLHIGEIHLYFDVTKRSPTPHYVNCSFYGNYKPFRVAIDSKRLKHLTQTLKFLLTSDDLLQIKFPVARAMFNNCDQLYGAFAECQKNLMQNAMFTYQTEWIPNGKWFRIEPNRQSNAIAGRQQSISRDYESGAKNQNRVFGRKSSVYKRNGRNDQNDRRTDQRVANVRREENDYHKANGVRKALAKNAQNSALQTRREPSEDNKLMDENRVRNGERFDPRYAYQKPFNGDAIGEPNYGHKCCCGYNYHSMMPIAYRYPTARGRPPIAVRPKSAVERVVEREADANAFRYDNDDTTEKPARRAERNYRHSYRRY